MRLLLDTHVFLWAVAKSGKLNAAAHSMLRDPANELFLSAAAVWEIAIKFELGKLPLPVAPGVYVPSRARTLKCADLAITQRHALAVSALPSLHADPFDRMMIAQAQVENMTIVTADSAVLQYPVAGIDAR